MKKQLIAASIIILAACSSSPKQLQIDFTPSAVKASNEVVVNNLMLSINTKDIRTAQYIALIDNGNHNIQPVHTKQNVRMALEMALVEQLQSQGYKVSVEDQKAFSNNRNMLSLDIQHLLVNIKQSAMSNEMDAKITLQITAETPAGKLVKTFNGSATKAGVFSASSTQIEQIVNNVTNLVLTEIANDTELNHYMKERF